MKKILIMILCCAMICVATGCVQEQTKGGQTKGKESKGGLVISADSPVTELGTLPIVSKPVTLSCLFVKAFDNVDYSVENNVVLQWILEQTGIKLDIEYVSAADAVTRKQVILASDDYPDIIWHAGLSQADVANYGMNEKILIPLNELIENYSYWFNDCLEEMPNLLTAVTQADGNIYGIPNSEVSYHTEYSKKMWVNCDWLEALGLDAPETTEEFYNMLVAFKTQDPNGNGVTDEVPLTGSTPGWYSDPCLYLLNSFVPYNNADYTPYLFNDDGTVRTCATMEEYREGLRYMNKLYEERLLDSSAFTQAADDVFRISSGETKVYGAVPAGHMGIFTDTSNYEQNEKPYQAIAPIEGPSGRRAAPYLPSGVSDVAYFVITDKCEYPEVAWRFLDFLYYWETDLNIHYGMEGIAWEKLPEDTELKTVDGAKARAHLLEGYCFSGTELLTNVLYMRPSYMGYGHNYGWLANETSEEEWNHKDSIVNVLKLYTDRYAPYGDNESIIGPLRYTLESLNELSQLKLSMNTYLDDARIQFIMGTMDLDKDWDSYVNTVNSSGMDLIIEIVQEAYKNT